jgi:hypothetical protein
VERDLFADAPAFERVHGTGTGVSVSGAVSRGLARLARAGAKRLLVIVSSKEGEDIVRARAAAMAPPLEVPEPEAWATSPSGIRFLRDSADEMEQITGLDLGQARAALASQVSWSTLGVPAPPPQAQGVLALGRPSDEHQAYARALRLNNDSSAVLVVRILMPDTPSVGLVRAFGGSLSCALLTPAPRTGAGGVQRGRGRGDGAGRLDGARRVPPGRRLGPADVSVPGRLRGGAGGLQPVQARAGFSLSVFPSALAKGVFSCDRAPSKVSVELLIPGAADRILKYVLPVTSVTSVSGDRGRGVLELGLRVSSWCESFASPRTPSPGGHNDLDLAPPAQGRLLPARRPGA